MSSHAIPENYSPAPDLLQDRVILVTGAGDGIGRAVARHFAQYGATVVLTGRTVQKLEAVYDEITEAKLIEPVIFPLDLATAGQEEFNGLAGGIAQEFGRLDGIVHNAAELGALTPIDHYPEELLQRVLKVNLQAPIQLTQACLPLLRQADDASVLFTTTNQYEKTSAYWGAYGISKQGLDAFMLILADELENNSQIRVNSIDPGAIRSRLRNLAYPAEDPSSLHIATDVVHAYLYMVGPDSHMLKGQLVSAFPG